MDASGVFSSQWWFYGDSGFGVFYDGFGWCYGEFLVVLW